MRWPLHPRRTELVAWLQTLDMQRMTGKTWRDLFDHSYSTWARNGRAWDRRLATGGTYTLRAIMWYQHVERPGSTDSRPGIILPRMVAAMDAETAALAEMVCAFGFSPHDPCEACRAVPGSGEPCYWLADGGLSPDGTYLCETCARWTLRPDAHRDPTVACASSVEVSR